MDDSKYVVFKRDEFDQELGRIIGHDLREVKFHELQLDAIVLRMQDRFSAPAMQAYFDAVSNALEVLEDFGIISVPAVLKDLEVLRDWAFNTTQDARNYKYKKIPDQAQ